MPLDPAQRHQIEQDAITAAWEAERLTACDDDGDVIIGADETGHNDLLARINAFLSDHAK